MQTYLIGFLLAFFISLIISPFVIKLTKKLKFGQNILHYVDNHSQKQGTPTMGGIIFIVGIILAFLFISRGNNKLGLISISVFFAYGLIGFLDDFLKIKHKNNLGLKAYQKIIGQALIALIVSIFVYTSGIIPNSIKLPFSNIWINLSWGIIPFVFFVFLATTNAVNLTDGLDGLAGGVSSVYLMGFFTVLEILILKTNDGVVKNELSNLALLGAISIGSIFAYLCFNSFPAKIFMGDTGSLALGGLITSLAIFSGLEIFIVFFGIMFVLSVVSVIIQVIYFKATKGKRVFLMAPLHHHFEKKGVNETKIVTIYLIITAVISVITVLLEIKFGGVI